MKCLGALASLKGSSSVFNPCSIGGRKIRRSLSQGYPCQNPTSSKIASNIVLATRRGRRFNAFAKKGQTVHRFKAQLSVKHAFEGLDRQKGKFRSFLLASLEHFLANERDRARAAKRGGGHTFVSFDPETAEHCYLQDPAADLSPERVFDQRWALALLERALARLREEYVSKGKLELFNHLKAFLTNEAK